MRKRLKRKRRSCTLCKPNKTGGDVRWSGRELAQLVRFEKAKTKGDWMDV